MTLYRIESTAGLILGTYAGDTPDAAVSAMHADAGGAPDGDPMAELIVTEVADTDERGWKVVLADGAEYEPELDADNPAHEVSRYGAQAVIERARDAGLVSVDNPIRALVTPTGDKITQF